MEHFRGFPRPPEAPALPPWHPGTPSGAQPTTPEKLTLRMYLRSWVPSTGSMRGQSPTRPGHRSRCMACSAWPMAYTASITNCTFPSCSYAESCPMRSRSATKRPARGPYVRPTILTDHVLDARAKRGDTAHLCTSRPSGFWPSANSISPGMVLWGMIPQGDREGPLPSPLCSHLCALRPQNSQGRPPCHDHPQKAVGQGVSLRLWNFPAFPLPDLDQLREPLGNR